MSFSGEFKVVEITIRREGDLRQPYHQAGQLPMDRFRYYFTRQAVEEMIFYPTIQLKSEFDNEHGYAAVRALITWIMDSPAEGMPCPNDFEFALWLRRAARAMRLRTWIYEPVYQRIRDHIAGPPDKFLSAEDFIMIAEIDPALASDSLLNLAVDEVVAWHSSHPATELSREHWQRIVAYGRRMIPGRFIQYDTADALIDETRLADPTTLGWRSRARSVGDLPCENTAVARDVAREYHRWESSWRTDKFGSFRTRQRNVCGE